MKARAGHYQGLRDDRGHRYSDEGDREDSRRYVRRQARREVQDIHREVRLRGIQAADQ